jgi:hypothetical protein
MDIMKPFPQSWVTGAQLTKKIIQNQGQPLYIPASTEKNIGPQGSWPTFGLTPKAPFVTSS